MDQMIPLPESVEAVTQEHIDAVMVNVCGFRKVKKYYDKHLDIWHDGGPYWQSPNGSVFLVKYLNPYLHIFDSKLLDAWLVEKLLRMQINFFPLTGCIEVEVCGGKNKNHLIGYALSLIELEPFARTTAIVQAYNKLKGDNDGG